MDRYIKTHIVNLYETLFRYHGHSMLYMYPAENLEVIAGSVFINNNISDDPRFKEPTLLLTTRTDDIFPQIITEEQVRVEQEAKIGKVHVYVVGSNLDYHPHLKATFLCSTFIPIKNRRLELFDIYYMVEI